MQRTGDYSWRSLLGNPHALLVTGMVSTVLVKDALLRTVGMSRFALWT